MELQVLGPLQVMVDGQEVPLGGPKERKVLAVLACHAPRPVSDSALIEAVWGDDPPRTAQKTIQSYVSRLRRTLGDTIRTGFGGYVLELDTDVARVDDLIDEARMLVASGQTDKAVEVYRAAEAVWRGPAYGDFAEEAFATPVTVQIAELHQTCIEERLAAELESGAATSVAAELEGLCAEHPYRERLWSHRMLALYRSGRQADALMAYETLRARLSEDLGIDPSGEIQRLHTAILRQDPSLAPHGPHEYSTGLVTFLFTDIEGSTPLWDLHEAAMAAALERHDEIIAAAVKRGGGRLLRMKGEGDSSLSVFDDPTAAAHAAVEIQRQLRDEFWPDPITNLAVRMSLHTGEAQFRAGTYFGPALNRGARIRDLALGGQIFASASTAALLEDVGEDVRLLELGHRPLRGLMRGESVVELVWDRAERPAARPQPTLTWMQPPLPAPLARQHELVGRTQELQRLDGVLEEVLTGAQRTVLIGGEPGIGKTGLAAEVAKLAHERGATVLFGWADEDVGIPYQPFIEPVRTSVHAVPLGSLLDRIGPPARTLVRLMPELGEQLGRVDVSGGTLTESERYALFEAVTALIGEVATRGPVVMVLDDLQWADRQAQLLLRHLVRSQGLGGVLILGAFRDTERGSNPSFLELLADLWRERGIVRMSLTGLDLDGTADLLRSSLGSLDEQGLRLASAIRHETQGNPFFIHEVLQHLVEAGVLYQRDGALVSHFDVADLGLPESVREVVDRRLMRLGDHAQRVLLVAAVAGPTFSFDVLDGVPEAAGDSNTLLDALEEAATAGLIRETADGFVFSHALVRQTLLSGASTMRIVMLHQRIAEAMEGLPEISTEALAHHFLEAANQQTASRAAEYALEAGSRALDRLATEDAAALFQRGLDALELSPDPDLRLRARLRAQLGVAIWDSEGSEGRSYLRAAAADAYAIRSPEILIPVVFELSSKEFFASSDPETRIAVERALEVAADAPLDLQAQAQAAYAHYLGPVDGRGPEAVVEARRAVSMAEQAGDKFARRCATIALAECLVGTPDAAERLRVAEEAIALAGNIHLSTRPATHQVTTLLELGRRDDAHHIVEEYRVSGPLNWSAETIVRLADISFGLFDGRFDESEVHAQGLLTIYPQSDLASLFYTAALVWIRREQGRFAEVQPVLAGGAAYFPNVTTLTAAMAAFLAEIDNLDDASIAFDRLIADDLASVRRDALWPHVIAFLAEAAATMGRVEHAQRLYDHLAPFSGLAIILPWGYASLGGADRHLGILATELGDHDAAQAHFASAVELEHRLRAPTNLARTRLWWGRSLIRHGEVAQARTVLEEALEGAEVLGMSLIAHDARALLEG